MESITVPESISEGLYTEKGSRFIGTVIPVSNEEETAEILKEIRKKYYDATHNCYAYSIHPAIEKSSDDGEPSGSAGRPILSVINGHELTNILVVVTRYYGGTKLGVGGLVRAYSETAKIAIEHCRTAVLEPVTLMSIKTGYSETQFIYHFVEKLNKIHIEKEIYHPDGTEFILKMPSGQVSNLEQKLQEKLNRVVEGVIMEEKIDKI